MILYDIPIVICGFIENSASANSNISAAALSASISPPNTVASEHPDHQASLVNSTPTIEPKPSFPDTAIFNSDQSVPPAFNSSVPGPVVSTPRIDAAISPTQSTIEATSSPTHAIIETTETTATVNSLQTVNCPSISHPIPSCAIAVTTETSPDRTTSLGAETSTSESINSPPSPQIGSADTNLEIMATNIPAELRAADLTRFIVRAAQLEGVKPVVAYWCKLPCWKFETSS